MKLTTAVAKIAAAAEVARAAAQAEARSQAAGADTRAAAADTEGHLESICDPMDPDAIQEGTMRKRSM